MKKRTLAALLGTLTALSSVAPTMVQAAENTEEYTVTFCRTQDSTMESDIFSVRCAQIFVGIIPIILIYPFAQKYFVKGMTVGSVKG